MQSRHALAKDVLLADQYRIDTVLGSGGFGITYMAHDVGLGSQVVVKEYFPAQIAVRDKNATVHPRSQDEHAIYEWGRERFVREARILDSCRHANIVRVRRVFEANNTAYMALDFADGPSLEGWLKRLGRAPTQGEMDAIVWPLLEALAYLHDLPQPVIHRDIAPDNIIMRDGNHPVLIDFGAARVEAAGRAESRVSAVKDGYSPREQYSQRSELQGPWTDIYAMGATIRRSITGERPPDSMGRDLDDAMVPLAQLAPAGYRLAFLEGIDASMAVQHRQRPQSVAAWRDMLFEGMEAAPLTRSSTRPSRPRVVAGTGTGRTGTRQTGTTSTARRPTLEPQPDFPRASEAEALVGTPPPPRSSAAGLGRTIVLAVCGVLLVGAAYGAVQIGRNPSIIATPAPNPGGAPTGPPAGKTTPPAPSPSPTVAKAPAPAPSAPAPAPAPSTGTAAARQAAAECERLAKPNGRDVTGVQWEDMDGPAAMAQCQAAAQAFPNDARYETWLGRALAKTRNEGAAKQWLERAANKGEPYAQFHLGLLYAGGLGGIPRDYVKAREWLEKAALQEEPYALAELGVLSETGRGAPADTVRAREYYERSAALGHPPAMNLLGLAHENGKGGPVDLAKAREWFEKAAALGFSSAALNLGNIYNNGRGVPADSGRAFTYFTQAAAKDNLGSINNLGQLYEQGKGVAQDYAKARELYEKAANLGNLFSMTNLGILYEQGRGVTVDYAKAREWYEKAAERNHGRGYSNLGMLYANARGVAQDDVAARGWLEKSVERNDSWGQYNLAIFLDKGRGGDKDAARSAKLLLQAAKGGSTTATGVLAGLMARWAPETIRALQTQLQAAGSYQGQITGTWDAASQAAAQKFAETK